MVRGAKWTRNLVSHERIRNRVLAAFIAVHFLALFLLPISHPFDLALPVPDDWLRKLSLYVEQSAGSKYAGILFIAAAALGIVQAFRSGPQRVPRWLWPIGWLSVAGSAFVVVVVDLSELVDLGNILTGRAIEVGWLFAITILVAPVLASGALVFWASQLGHPVRVVLTGLVFILGGGSIVRDILTRFYSGTSWDRDYLTNYLEEAWELLGVIIVIVLLLNLSFGKPELSMSKLGRPSQAISGRFLWGSLAVSSGLLILLAIYASNLYIKRMDVVFEGESLGRGAPHSFTGPVTLVEQQFSMRHDNLSQISLWGYIDGGAEGETAEVFARLRAAGSDQLVRESRAEVFGSRLENTSVVFEFEPIPDSGGEMYSLSVGVLGGPEPWVFLGLTGAGAKSDSAVKISGERSRFGDVLAMTTYWTGRAFLTHMGGADSDPRRIVFAVDLAITTFLWVFAVLATERGISGHQAGLWSRDLTEALWRSVMVTTGIATVGMLLSPLLLAGKPHI